MHAAWILPVMVVLLWSLGCASSAKSSGRDTASINSGWRFVRADVPEANLVKFDDSSWESVDLPHCWDTSGQHSGGKHYRGPAWYRRTIKLSAAAEGRRTVLRFGAASMAASVYLNGRFVGEHRGGFAAFAFDVTAFVHPGENLLAVRVDSSRDENLAPLSGDFTIFGGLYRDVEILNFPAVHISPLDDGSCGVYLTQKSVTREKAVIEAKTLLRNTSGETQQLTLSTEVRNADGKVVASAVNEVSVAGNSTEPAVQTLIIHQPHLWDGVRDPYLHSAVIRIRKGNATIDELQQPLGLRFFKVDPDAGLIFNGRPYPYRGVNLHQEAHRKGWATTNEDLDRDYALIRELGCTGVRLAHYQHPPRAHEICDESGLIVWAELCLVNQITASKAFSDNAKQQLRELIKQNYNHPSILFWSLFNEINISTGDARWNLVRELNALAHELDPTRPTAAASNLGLDHESILIPDIIAFNRYFGWYSGTPDGLDGELNKIRKLHPTRSVGMSEYGAGASIYQHELNPINPQAGGKWHPEQWQSIFHESAWQAQSKRDYLWCNLIWVMFDFSADGRNEGDTPGVNDKGLVTMDRKTRKDAFYFYKANWSRTPFVYIAERRLTTLRPGRRTIKVYSNCDEVECFLNGKSLGSRRGELGVFLWEDVEFTAGEARVEVQAADKEGRQHDRITWHISPAATTQQTTKNPALSGS